MIALPDVDSHVDSDVRPQAHSHHRHRRMPSVWSLRKVAAAATRGLFGLPTTTISHSDRTRPHSDVSYTMHTLSLDDVHIPPATMTSARRPVISSPSQPRHLIPTPDSNHKLSYPIMSPLSPFPPPRRRTTSAPAPAFKPSSDSSMFPPPPSFNQLGLDFSATTTPPPSQSSPRSISSVKRKPVPRHSLVADHEDLQSPPPMSPFLCQRRRPQIHLDCPIPVQKSKGHPLLSPLSTPQTPQSSSSSTSSLSFAQNQDMINALSPLTVEEMDAIQTFAKEAELGSNGTRQRRRRRVRSRRPDGDQAHGAYHMHTAIVNSYFDGSDEDELPVPVAKSPTEAIPGVLESPISIVGASSSASRREEAHPTSPCVGVSPSLRVNRATFGVYEGGHVLVHAATNMMALADGTEADSDEKKKAPIKDSAAAGHHCMAISRREADQADHPQHADADQGCDTTSPGTPAPGQARPEFSRARRARRGGMLARDEGAVAGLVKTTRPVFSGTRSSPDLRRAYEDDTSSEHSSNTSYSHVRVGVGLAIMSREDIARFEEEVEREEKDERRLVSAFSSCSSEGACFDDDESEENEEVRLVSAFSSCSSSEGYFDDDEDEDEDEDGHGEEEDGEVSPLTDDMPVTPTCARTRARTDVFAALDDADADANAELSCSFDRLQSSLSKLRATHSPSRASVGLLGSSVSSKCSRDGKADKESDLARIPSSSSEELGMKTPCEPGRGFFVPVPSSTLLSSSEGPRSPTFSAKSTSTTTSSTSTTNTNHSASTSSKYYACAYQYTTPTVPSFVHLSPKGVNLSGHRDNSEGKGVAMGKGGLRLRRLFWRGREEGRAKK